MGVESFFHYMRNVIGSAQSSMNTQQMAFIRQMQKEMKVERALTIPLKDLEVVVFDIETTGFFPERGDQIISIGAIKVKGTDIKEDETFYSLVQFMENLPKEISELTGIQQEELRKAPTLSQVLVQFFKFIKDDTLVAHHANHEKNFMQTACWKQFRTPFKHRIVDTSFLFRITDPEIKLVTLDECCQYNQIKIEDRHHALGDAKLTAQIWRSHLIKVQEYGCKTLQDIYEKLAKRT